MATAESQIFSKTAHVNTDGALTRIYRLSRRLAKLMLPAVVSSKET